MNAELGNECKLPCTVLCFLWRMLAQWHKPSLRGDIDASRYVYLSWGADDFCQIQYLSRLRSVGARSPAWQRWSETACEDVTSVLFAVDAPLRRRRRTCRGVFPARGKDGPIGTGARPLQRRRLSSCRRLACAMMMNTARHPQEANWRSSSLSLTAETCACDADQDAA